MKSKIILNKITIKRYRSINNLSINVIHGIPLIICGSNNVGKTNFLRALDLFFSLDENKFDAKNDIPYDIEVGKRGGGYNTTIIGKFTDPADNKYEIATIFKAEKDIGNTLEIKAKKNRVTCTLEEAIEVVNSFRFLFIEASNIDIPKIIDEIIDDEILPLGLDPKRSKQTIPLKKLEDFIAESKSSVASIEKDIDKILNEFIKDIPGIDTRDWKIQILFSEYTKLRQAISGIIDFTLHDKNNMKMESKGSGIQRVVLLSLMKYITKKSKKNIIWGIDEPEAFLQPALQKRTFEILKELSQNQYVFLASHSQYFVDISDIANTHLFEADYAEKEYVRKKGEVFYRVNTFVNNSISTYEKIQKIKQHLGISRNDSWEIMPYNILVEGEEDKEYLETLMHKLGAETPNILFAGGVTKIKGYLQFISEFCSEIPFKPTILCLFDHDEEGQKEYDSITKAISKNTYRYFDLTAEFLPRCDGKEDSHLDYEIEDLLFPKVIFDAANKFLKKQGYTPIPNNDLKSRFEDAYDKECILKFISEKARANNADKDPVDFENGGGGIKKIICKFSCEYIKKHDISDLNSTYSEVTEFVKRIAPQP